MKNKILNLVKILLDSALLRGVEQGVAVFRKSIDFLDGCTSEQEVFDALVKLNKALAGIEAHGHLTEEEFILVKELREMEQDVRTHGTHGIRS